MKIIDVLNNSIPFVESGRDLFDAIQSVIFRNYDRKLVTYKDVVKNIPEYTPEYFGLKCNPVSFWWKDSDSNLKALNTLIDLYINSNKEFIL